MGNFKSRLNPSGVKKEAQFLKTAGVSDYRRPMKKFPEEIVGRHYRDSSPIGQSQIIRSLALPLLD